MPITVQPPPPVTIEVEEAVPAYSLLFQLIDKLGQPLKKIPWKALPAGHQKALHQTDKKTDNRGKTPVVSTEQNESIDFYLVWADLKVTKNTDEG